MLDKKVWSVLIVILLFFPSVVWGQDMMDGKWWQNRKIAEKLEITKTEKQLLDERYVESRRKLISLKSDVERERFELDNLLDRGGSKKETIQDQYIRLEEARANLSKERFNLFLEVRNIVGIERYQQLKAMHRSKRTKTSKRYSDERRDKRDRRD